MPSNRSVRGTGSNSRETDIGQALAPIQNEGRLTPSRQCAWGATWDRIVSLDANFWLSHPPAPFDNAPPCFSFEDWHADEFHTVLVSEVEYALSHGLRQTSPLALALLASLALQRRDDVDAAVRLGKTALALASRDGVPCLGQTYALFTCLILPYTDDLHRLIAGVADMASSSSIPAAIASRGLCTAFAAGAPVQSMISQAKSMLSRLPSGESGLSDGALSVSFSFLHQLACGEFAAPSALAPCQNLTDDSGSGAMFAYWVARLQAAWYSYDRNGALFAFRHAARIDGLFMPVMDRMVLRLFGVLILVDDDDDIHTEHIRRYCADLTAWAAKHPASGAAMAMLANAVHSNRAEDSLTFLRGCEGAATCAMRHGQHWLAALAWDNAAQRAQEAGLGSMMGHYRAQSLLCYERWGAWGRADELRRRWQDDGQTEDYRGETGWNTWIPNGIVGELALSIAHEINQPLAAIALHAMATRKWLRREPPDIERAMASLTLISTAGKHAFEVVRAVQRLSSSAEREIHDTDIDQRIGQVLQLLRRPLRKHRVEVEVQLGIGDCTVKADSAQLQQLVTNLLLNAIEALAAVDGKRRIRVESRRDDGYVQISVADNGAGIPKAHREQIFDSMFSTKANNSGMGLSISRAIVRAHGGQISFHECDPTGVRFVVRLPVCGNPSFSIEHLKQGI